MNFTERIKELRNNIDSTSFDFRFEQLFNEEEWLGLRLTSASNMNVNSENMSTKVMYCVFHMLHKITFACVCITLFITIMKSNITLNLMFNQDEKSLRYWMNSNIGFSTL